MTFGEMTGNNRTTIKGKMPLLKAINAESSSYHTHHAVLRGKVMKSEAFVDTVVGVRRISVWRVENIAGFAHGFDEEGRWRIISTQKRGGNTSG